MRHATLYFAAFGVAAICLYGCASAKKADTISVASQPTSAPVTIDASQITAQVVAQAKQELKAQIDSQVQATVNAMVTAQGFGTYNSQFGIGPTIVMLALIMALWRSTPRKKAK